MVQIAAVVPEYVCLLSNVADNHIHVAVIVDVTKGGAASSPGLLKYLASAHFFEMAGLVMNQERRLQISQVWSGLLDRIHDMRLCNEKILPAVVVIIEKTRTPARKRQARSAQTRALRHVPECAVSVDVEKHGAPAGKISLPGPCRSDSLYRLWRRHRRTCRRHCCDRGCSSCRHNCRDDSRRGNRVSALRNSDSS